MIGNQVNFGETPHPFNSMDMICAIGKFIIARIDPDKEFYASWQPTTFAPASC